MVDLGRLLPPVPPSQEDQKLRLNTQLFQQFRPVFVRKALLKPEEFLSSDMFTKWHSHIPENNLLEHKERILQAFDKLKKEFLPARYLFYTWQ